MSTIKHFVKQLPIAGPMARAMYRLLIGGRRNTTDPFPGSAKYWEDRYLTGGSSGVGSYGKFARFKAEVLNAFVNENGVENVIEFGCGDGNQLELAKYPRYLGVDVSEAAVALCRVKFCADKSKSFCHLTEYDGATAELSLSLDVIYHLVENNTFENYMQCLFNSSTRFVIIYSSNIDDDNYNNDIHVRHRKFNTWVDKNADGWSLIKHVPNKYPYAGDYTKGSFSDFYIFERIS